MLGTALQVEVVNRSCAGGVGGAQLAGGPIAAVGTNRSAAGRAAAQGQRPTCHSSASLRDSEKDLGSQKL